MQIYVKVGSDRVKFGSDRSQAFLIRREVLQLLAGSSGLRAVHVTEKMNGMDSLDFEKKLKLHQEVVQALTFLHGSKLTKGTEGPSGHTWAGGRTGRRWQITPNGRKALKDLERQIADRS